MQFADPSLHKTQYGRLLCIDHNGFGIILSLPPAKWTGQFPSAPLAPRAQCQQNKDWRKRNMASAHAKELSGTLCPPNPFPLSKKLIFLGSQQPKCVQLTS